MNLSVEQVLFVYFKILFAKFLLRMFAFMFMRDMSL